MLYAIVICINHFSILPIRVCHGYLGQIRRSDHEFFFGLKRFYFVSIVLNLVLIFDRSKLPNTLIPNEKGNHMLTAICAFVFEASQNVPLLRVGNQIAVAKNSLHNQLLLLNATAYDSNFINAL